MDSRIKRLAAHYTLLAGLLLLVAFIAWMGGVNWERKRESPIVESLNSRAATLETKQMDCLNELEIRLEVEKELDAHRKKK